MRTIVCSGKITCIVIVFVYAFLIYIFRPVEIDAQDATSSAETLTPTPQSITSLPIISPVATSSADEAVPVSTPSATPQPQINSSGSTGNSSNNTDTGRFSDDAGLQKIVPETGNIPVAVPKTGGINTNTKKIKNILLPSVPAILSLEFKDFYTIEELSPYKKMALLNLAVVLIFIGFSIISYDLLNKDRIKFMNFKKS